MGNDKSIEIKIITNGYFDGTRLFVDGEEWKVSEINFSASIPRRTPDGWRGGKCHFQVQRDVNGMIMPLAFYAGTFEKLAEARELQKEKENSHGQNDVTGRVDS